MKHRLLHTLVFSSGLLLDGCATTHGSMPDAGPAQPDAPVPTPDAMATPDAPSAPDAFEPPDAFVPPDAFSPDAAVIITDPRACEPGWPTTKAVFDVERDGVRYGCRSPEVSHDDPDLSLCCVITEVAP